MIRRWALEALVAVLYVFVGAVFGLVTTFAHRYRIDVAGTEWWVGLVAGLAALLLFGAGMRAHLDERGPVIAYAVGVIGAVFLLATGGPGHSVVIPGAAFGAAGSIWVYGSAAAVALPALWPKLPPRGERPAPPPAAEPGPSAAEPGRPAASSPADAGRSSLEPHIVQEGDRS